MKLLGIEPIEGGVAIALPSGRQVLVALPGDRQHAAHVLGDRVLELLDDPDEPHAQRSVPLTDEDEPDDALAALDAGIEAGRLVWRTLQMVSRGRGR